MPVILNNYGLAASALAAVALWALYQFAERMRRDRLLHDTPLVKIRSAAQGYVKVFGRAGLSDEEPMSAPLSNRPCVWWSYSIEERQTQRGAGRSAWHTVDSGASIKPFVLTDATGECLVGSVNAEITATVHDVWFGDQPRPWGAPPKTKIYIESCNYRYTERLLRVGDLLSVTGELRSISEISTAEAAAAATLRQWKLDQPRLLARFDKNHDGKIDTSEWDAARQAAMAESHSKALKSAITRTSVIGEPTHGEPFLIAAMDSKHLVLREKLFAILFLVLGISSAALCAWAIQQAKLP